MNIHTSMQGAYTVIIGMMCRQRHSWVKNKQTNKRAPGSITMSKVIAHMLFSIKYAFDMFAKLECA